MKLGKQPATVSGHDLLLTNYATKLPSPPERFGHGGLVRDWGMLGNDAYGDCVFAGGAHETMLYNKLGKAKRLVKFSDDSVLNDYTAVTGFNPDDPSTDNGTYVREALNFRRHVGLMDAAKTRHKIGAFVSIPVSDWEKMLSAVFIFGAVGIGFNFPSSAFAQFDAKQPWSVVEGDTIEGGHYVCLVGSMHADREISVISWGRRQVMTREFYETYNDEAWAILSPEILDSSGKGLHGFDLATLKADLAAL